MTGVKNLRDEKTAFFGKYLPLSAVALSLSLALPALAETKPAARAGAGSAAGGNLDQSKKVKFKDKTEVNFDDAHIEGAAKNPFGQFLNNRDQDFNRGFIKLRYNWHDQMIMSVSGLSQ